MCKQKNIRREKRKDVSVKNRKDFSVLRTPETFEIDEWQTMVVMHATEKYKLTTELCKQLRKESLNKIPAFFSQLLSAVQINEFYVFHLHPQHVSYASKLEKI